MFNKRMFNKRILKPVDLIKPLAITSLLLTLSGCITVNATSLDYQETKKLSLKASDIKVLQIDAAAGFLIIQGDSSLNSIEVTADIEAYDEDIKLSLKADGNRAELIANAAHKQPFNWGNNSPKIDLTIKLPASIKLAIKDGSGKIEIRKIDNDLKLDDGSGSIHISDIKGNVIIEDGSGSLTIHDVEGELKITDGSGSLDIQHIDGAVKIEDGSGSMDVFDIAGLVTIDDGSGSINLKNLRNGLTIIEEGSGGLSMSDIKGPVSIK